MQTLSNNTIILGGLCGLLVLAFYFIYVLKNPKASIPFIICSSWFVIFEPAPYDIFSGLAILAFVLNLLVFKKSIPRLDFIDFMLVFFVALNINTLINTDDISHSYRYFFITLYLVAFFFLISKLSESYAIIEKQLIFFLVPCFVTSLALLVGHLSSILNINMGIFTDILVQEGRAKAFFKDPNVAGPSLILPGIYSFARILNKKAKANSLFLCVFSLSAIAVFLTLSRAAIVALLSSTFLVLIFSVETKKLFKILSILVFSILAISIILMYMPKGKLFFRIHNTEIGVQGRVESIERGFSAFKKSPLIGSGMRLRMTGEAPHDSYFLLLTQTGLIGFLCFWIPVVYLTGRLLLASRYSFYYDEKIILLTLGASLSSHLIFGLVIYFLHWRHFWFTLGLATAGVRLMSVAPEDQDEASQR